MNNSYILLRHAHSRFSSDDFNRTLSEKGFSSLNQLDFLNSFNIDYYFSSPYKRALFIEDTEFEKTIQYLWQNPDKSLIGGESNREALNRILDLFEDLEERYSDKTILLSSHGNLLGILINHFDSSFDYKKWEQMTFPDCFLVDKDKSVKRIMKVTSR